MRVKLKNDIGRIVEAKLGFSWVMFFFSSFVPLFRQDWKWAGIMWGSWLLLLLLAPSIMYIFSIFALIMSFIYNKIYITELLNKGFKPLSDADKQVLIQGGFTVISDDKE